MIFGKFLDAPHGIAVFAFVSASVISARAQTPSPLQEWQYSGGVVLQRVFKPDLPDWLVVTGEVRIGAKDVTVLNGIAAAEQVKGVQFEHFAAFLSRSYRGNDYLLERLHTKPSSRASHSVKAGHVPRASGATGVYLERAKCVAQFPSAGGVGLNT